MSKSAGASDRMVHAFLHTAFASCLVSALLPIVVPLFNRLSREDLATGARFYAKLGMAALVVAGLGMAAWRLLRRGRAALAVVSEEQADYLDAMPGRRIDLAIAGAAALSLYVELAMIRWQATMFPFFAFYKNFSLLACFAGLGLGFALARRAHVPLVAVLPLLAFQMGLLTFVRYGLGSWNTDRVLYATPVLEQLDMGLGKASRVSLLIPLYMILACTFVLTALAFVPVGQLCGRLMELRPKLRAYGLNLLGSLVGVLAVFVTSYLWTPPVVWFALAFLPLLLFCHNRRAVWFVGLASALAALIVLAWPAPRLVQKIYSPYQMIERVHGANGLLEIRAAGHYHQRVTNLAKSNANRQTDKATRFAALYYEFPYKARGAPGRVAIVGSGTGNDVAAALRMGATHVDAIEIDPAILQLGEAYHPERPYASPRARGIVNDARTFFRTTRSRYDMVVYGLLDSHSLLSHASSVRLDSFVYTVEGIREARDCLNEDGALCLSFCVLGRALGRKIYLMMQEAFDGRPPLCVQSNYDGGVIFLQSEGPGLSLPPALLAESGFTEVTHEYADPAIAADVPTDDWPFFYMPRRVYPVSYLPMALVVLGLTLLLTRRLVRGGRPRANHVVYFLLGAGFMLVETKAITELGLTFGNTWHVIGIAILGILAMAFLANAAVARFGFRRPLVPYILLLGSLAGGYAVARSGGFSSDLPGRLAATAVLTCPMFFSGIIFSILLRRGSDISAIMAANLLGAMLGGLLEYNSMYFGFAFLYVLAMGIYALAFACTFLGGGPVAKTA